MADDYYAILGVSNEATSQEIKRSFREIARECHPDRAGSDEASEARFKKARKAYETLMDPVTRARYDRRGQRRLKPGESFFDAFYRHTGSGGDGLGGSEPATEHEASVRQQQAEVKARSAAGGPSGRKRRPHDPGNNVGLDDLFNDFGFGGGRAKTGPATVGRGANPGSERRAPNGMPSPGEDVMVELDVPALTAREGGSVTAVYHRMQRADSWRPGMGDPGLVRVQDIADIRIIPGTRAGEVLREKGLGHAGAHGGPYGDLVVRVRLVGSAQRAADAGRASAPPPEPRAEGRRQPRPGGRSDEAPVGAGEEPRATRTLDISVVEAMLGGRVLLETEQGPVRLSIAPGTSGGTKLRLKGRGPIDALGKAADLYVSIRIVVPKSLDEESRQLIERFAQLNPD